DRFPWKAIAFLYPAGGIYDAVHDLPIAEVHTLRDITPRVPEVIERSRALHRIRQMVESVEQNLDRTSVPVERHHCMWLGAKDLVRHEMQIRRCRGVEQQTLRA